MELHEFLFSTTVLESSLRINKDCFQNDKNVIYTALVKMLIFVKCFVEIKLQINFSYDTRNTVAPVIQIYSVFTINVFTLYIANKELSSRLELFHHHL